MIEVFRIRVVLDLFRDLLTPVAVGELKIAPVNHQVGEGVLQGKRCLAGENSAGCSRKGKRSDLKWQYTAECHR